jgi:hypothetical protein
MNGATTKQLHFEHIFDYKKQKANLDFNQEVKVF